MQPRRSLSQAGFVSEHGHLSIFTYEVQPRDRMVWIDGNISGAGFKDTENRNERFERMGQIDAHARTRFDSQF